jgi:hypothetical protein
VTPPAQPRLLKAEQRGSLESINLQFVSEKFGWQTFATFPDDCLLPFSSKKLDERKSRKKLK